MISSGEYNRQTSNYEADNNDSDDASDVVEPGQNNDLFKISSTSKNKKQFSFAGNDVNQHSVEGLISEYSVQKEPQ